MRLFGGRGRGRGQRLASRLAIACGVLAIARVSSGATVVVAVHDNQGHALADVRVGLMPVAPWVKASGSIYDRLMGTTTARGVTGGDGTLTLQDIPPGTYFVSSAARDRYLISPSNDLFGSPPVITVKSADERVPVELTFMRGDLVTLEAWMNDRPGAGLVIVFTEQATRREVRETLNPQGYREIVLPPGRWEATISPPPPGFLLLSLEMDRAPQAGATALIEITDGSDIVGLSWKYGTTSLLHGRVTWEGIPQKPNVQVVATLVRAGAWRAAAEERGGSSFRRVPAGLYDEEGNYEMHLLDGVWQVEVVGTRLRSRSPESVSLELAPGDEKQQDFHVVVEPGKEEAVLTVEVLAPDGRGLADASVAVWSFDETAAGITAKDPVRRGKTEGPYRALATFYGLPKGKYVIAAGHPDYTEAKTDPFDFEGKVGAVERKSVTLGAGAEVRAHATDVSHANVEGVALVVERIGEGPPSLVADPDLEGKRAQRRAATDKSGWAVVGGLDPGRYRVRAELSGPRAQTHIVRIGEGDGPLLDSVESTLAESEKKELRIALFPAAVIRAQLACSDRGPIPRAVAFRILPFPATPSSDDDPPDSELERAAILSKKDIMLTGKALDTLSAGPLSGASLSVGSLAAEPFLLAVRPMGHDRWTYPSGTEEVTRGLPIMVEDGKVADGGSIEIDCGPTIRLRPVFRSHDPIPDLRAAARSHDPIPDVREARAEIGSRDPIPDLREARVEAKIQHVVKPALPGEKQVDLPRSRQPIPPPFVDRSKTRITLRKLPEETVEAEVTVSHPFFVPGTIQVTPVVLALERGRESEIEVPVPEIGGVLEIEAGDAPGAVVTDAAGKQVRADAKAGQVRLESLKAGVYTVSLCADPDCARAARTWGSVEIAPAKITQLR